MHVVGEWALLHNFGDWTAAQEHGMHLLSADDHDTKDLLGFDDALRLPRGTVADLLWVECDSICCERVSREDAVKGVAWAYRVFAL